MYGAVERTGGSKPSHSCRVRDSSVGEGGVGNSRRVLADLSAPTAGAKNPAIKLKMQTALRL